MVDMTLARRQMVDCQIRPNDVTDYDIIDAFLAVPRENFLPASKRAIAYTDHVIGLETGDLSSSKRALMEVTPFAKMLQAVGVGSEDIVLNVACGVGYGAAILSKLASSVVATDNDQQLVDRASDVISEMDIDNVAIVKAELTAGLLSEAPFDVILIEGSVDEVPKDLLNQLREDGGRLVCVLGAGLAAQITVFLRQNGDISTTTYGNVSVPTLADFKTPETFTF